LDKFCIGRLDDNGTEASAYTVEYQDDTAEGAFYEVLKRRVEKFFRGNEVSAFLRVSSYLSTQSMQSIHRNSDFCHQALCFSSRAIECCLCLQLNPRTSRIWEIKAAVILAAFVASFCGTFFGFQSFLAGPLKSAQKIAFLIGTQRNSCQVLMAQWPLTHLISSALLWQASAACAAVLGASMGLVGVCIVHDVNHGAGLSSAAARYVLGTVVDLVCVLGSPSARPLPVGS
jgi:hypothetical protein